MYNSLLFSTFRVLCNHHLHQNIFITPKGTSHPLAVTTCPPSPFPSAPYPNICSLSPWIGLFWVFNINGITQFMTFWICFVLISIFFEAHPCSTMYLSSHSFLRLKVFHCMDRPHFFSTFSVSVHQLIDVWVVSFGLFTFWFCEECSYKYLASFCLKIGIKTNKQTNTLAWLSQGLLWKQMRACKRAPPQLPGPVPVCCRNRWWWSLWL